MQRHRSVGLLVALGLTMFAAEAQAQSPFGNVNDPFFLYYGFYLPRQQAQALQSGPEATLNALTAARQSYAATNRSDMFDPSGNTFNRFEGDDLFGGTAGRTTGNQPVARLGGNLNGRGVSVGTVARYNRFGSYHPAVRPGQSRNANVAVVRGRGFGGGGGGVGGFPSVAPNVGVPGPR